jgi:hypothetical protein
MICCNVGVPKRFLITAELESADAPIALIENWQPGSKRWPRPEINPPLSSRVYQS